MERQQGYFQAFALALHAKQRPFNSAVKGRHFAFAFVLLHLRQKQMQGQSVEIGHLPGTAKRS